MQTRKKNKIFHWLILVVNVNAKKNKNVFVFLIARNQLILLNYIQFWLQMQISKKNKNSSHPTSGDRRILYKETPELIRDSFFSCLSEWLEYLSVSLSATVCAKKNGFNYIIVIIAHQHDRPTSTIARSGQRQSQEFNSIICCRFRKPVQPSVAEMQAHNFHRTQNRNHPTGDPEPLDRASLQQPDECPSTEGRRKRQTSRPAAREAIALESVQRQIQVHLRHHTLLHFQRASIPHGQQHPSFHLHPIELRRDFGGILRRLGNNELWVHLSNIFTRTSNWNFNANASTDPGRIDETAGFRHRRNIGNGQRRHHHTEQHQQLRQHCRHDRHQRCHHQSPQGPSIPTNPPIYPNDQQNWRAEEGKTA